MRLKPEARTCPRRSSVVQVDFTGLVCRTTLAFSGLLPSESEEQVRCNGGFGQRSRWGRWGDSTSKFASIEFEHHASRKEPATFLRRWCDGDELSLPPGTKHRSQRNPRTS